MSSFSSIVLETTAAMGLTGGNSGSAGGLPVVLAPEVSGSTAPVAAGISGISLN